MTEEKLAPLRSAIDAIDDKIVALLVQRYALVEKVIAVKHVENIPVVLPERIEAVLTHVEEKASAQNLPQGMVRAIYKEIITQTCRAEERALKKK